MEKTYINIQGWMIQDLKLRGNELLLYAIIYGFSQDGKNTFYGSLSYIEKMMGISNRQVLRLLNKLKKDGLIECVETSHYRATDKMSLPTKCHTTTDKMSDDYRQNVVGATDKMSYNNNNTNNKDNNNIKIEKKSFFSILKSLS